MTEPLYRWVAESDPIVLRGENMRCFYCKEVWPGDDSDWHAPDCWYKWCREWVEAREARCFIVRGVENSWNETDYDCQFTVEILEECECAEPVDDERTGDEPE